MSKFSLKKDLNVPYVMDVDRVTGKTEQVGMNELAKNPVLWIQKGYGSYFEGDVKEMQKLAAAYTKKLADAEAAKKVPTFAKELQTAQEARLEALQGNKALQDENAALQAKYEAAMKKIAEQEAQSKAVSKKLSETAKDEPVKKAEKTLIPTEEIIKANSKKKK